MIVVKVLLATELSDAAAGLLHVNGADGVEVRDGESLPPPGINALATGQAEVRGFFAERAEAQYAADTLVEALGSSAELEELPVEDWSTSWKSHFRPVHRGRVLVVAPWMDEAKVPTPPGAVRVTLEPGLAFGTGDHPTTGLCLEAVDLFLQAHPGASVLDVGTGSGILAIAARKLEAGVTCGTDNDPIALRVARENAQANAVVFDLRAEPPQGVTFDLVVANILANTLVELAPRLAPTVAAGGRLVLSGILVAQGDEVEAAYLPFLTARGRTEDTGWVCAVFDKEP